MSFKWFLKMPVVLILLLLRYGDSVEENSSVFSLIPMRWLPSARACGQKNFAPCNKILEFLTGDES